MSQLFEALQRSESERLGALSPSSAAELVQVAEQQLPQVEAQQEMGECRQLMLAPSPESRLLSLTHMGSLGAEKLRLLALRLKNLRDTRKLKTVLITSTMPEEGKSLISANLAVTLARSRHLKTLLLECDLRRPTLSQVLTGRNLPGLSEVLQSNRGAHELMYETQPAGFFFLPAGAPPPNPLELMQSTRFQQILQQLSASFDWILIDSPPVLPLADTSLLMRFSDGVLMVAREGVTQRKPMQKAIEVIDPALLLGVVLNGSTNTDHENYYQRYAMGTESLETDSEGLVSPKS
jgi:capsular exopolysaccharide synthesis family protein